MSDSPHLFDLYCADKVALMHECMKNNYPVRKKFFNLKSSVQKGCLQLACYQRGATRIGECIEEFYSCPPSLHLLPIPQHDRGDGVESDPLDVLAFNQFCKSFQDLSEADPFGGVGGK